MGMKYLLKGWLELNIAIDLDNTLFANNIVNDTCDGLGIPRPYDYMLSDVPEYVRNAIFSKFKDVSLMTSLKPYYGVRDILSHWHAIGLHDLHVVTSRDKLLSIETQSMVYRAYPMIERVHLVTGYDKRGVFKTIRCSMVIDDNSDIIEQALELGIPNIVMISNEDTLYNHRFIDVFKERGVHVVRSIVDITDDMMRATL